MAPTVLLIEDSQTQAKQIRDVLESVGLTVSVANDGPEGIREALENPPDLIVLDIKLPSMDGYQVCRRLKRDKNTAHIPVIMLTVSDSSEATVQGLEVGADDYIPKDNWATENLFTSLRAFLPIDQ